MKRERWRVCVSVKRERWSVCKCEEREMEWMVCISVKRECVCVNLVCDTQGGTFSHHVLKLLGEKKRFSYSASSSPGSYMTELLSECGGWGTTECDDVYRNRLGMRVQGNQVQNKSVRVC